MNHDLGSIAEAFYNEELNSQVNFPLKVNSDLHFLLKFFAYYKQSNSVDHDLDMITQANNREGRPPPLQCGTFNGEEKDKFAFNIFFKSN